MNQPPSRLWTVALYAGMVIGAIGLFLLIRDFGERLSAPPALGGGSSAGSAVAAEPDILFHVLLALAAVLVAGRSVGMLLSRLGQPPVIGEVVAGILLGPSLLGRVAPGVSAYILPVGAAPYLGLVAQIGVTFYISPTLFAMLVIMALVTTLAAAPLLHLVHREEMVAARSDSWLANIG